MSSTPALSAGPTAGQTTRPSEPGHEWWRSAVIYQVYPRSFADADGDGIGDLPGVIAHLDDLVDLGVDALWLSPFYPSPQADAGYDVADYTDVDPVFGSLSDADLLVARAHDRGLRVLIDLVPNHTSDEHAWFAAALAAGPGSPERDVYVFRDGKGADGEQPPTDWVSVFGGGAWTRVVETDGRPGQWYLHLFDTKQPDLNWANPVVVERFHDVLRFWLDRGVDGFRVDVAHGLVKDPTFPDWAKGPDLLGASTAAPMWDQDGVHEVYRGWRAVLDGYDGDRMMVAEAWVRPPDRLAAYVRPDEMHQAFNFEFLDAPWTAAAQRAAIEATTAANAAVGATTSWVLDNHDIVRSTSRLGYPVGTARMNGIAAGDPQPDHALGLARSRAAALLVLALPGSAYVYQGQELGLPDHTALPDELRQDPAFHRTRGTAGAETGRDGCRVPLPWDSTAPGLGFGPTGATWLPQPEAYADMAPDRQRGVATSTLELYRAALRLRRELGLGPGDGSGRPAFDDDLPAGRDDVLAVRVGPGAGAAEGAVTVVTVFGGQPWPLPAGAQVLLASAELLTVADGTPALPGDASAWIRTAP